MSCSSSSVMFSPSSFATRLRFLKEILPVLSSSNNLNTLLISSLVSFSPIFPVIISRNSGNSIWPEPSASMSVIILRSSSFFTSKEELRKMITDIDADGSGQIEFPEFLEMMTGKMGEKDTKEEINKVFKLFDDDCTGKISFKNLKRVAKELGENMTEEELQDMIDQADRDGDGEINPDEFYRIMKKRGDNPLDDLLDDDDD